MSKTWVDSPIYPTPYLPIQERGSLHLRSEEVHGTDNEFPVEVLFFFDRVFPSKAPPRGEPVYLLAFLLFFLVLPLFLFNLSPRYIPSQIRPLAFFVSFPLRLHSPLGVQPISR